MAVVTIGLGNRGAWEEAAVDGAARAICHCRSWCHMTDPREVLVVEDDHDLREIYADVLRDEGWRVHVARDGLEALDLLEAGLRPCVAVLDLRMPRMDGWELAGRLRQNEEWANLPFVVVAAHVRIAEEARLLGARWWLQKPVSIDRLVDTVLEACASRGDAST